MRLLVLALCLLKLAHAGVFFENYKIVRVDLAVLDRHMSSITIHSWPVYLQKWLLVNVQLKVNFHGRHTWTFVQQVKAIHVLVRLSLHWEVNKNVVASSCLTIVPPKNWNLSKLGWPWKYWYIEPTKEAKPDILIIRLAGSFEINLQLQQIRLPPSTWTNHKFNYEGYIMGFGLGNDGQISRYLQYGHFKMVPGCACELREYEICAFPSLYPLTFIRGSDSGKPVQLCIF